MKQNVLDEINIFLLKKGFTIKNFTRSCFDVLARKNEQILLIKVLEDANSISREYAEEMASVSYYCSASALVIAEKAGTKLENNVVYSRFDLNTLNINTFFNCINNKLPFIKRSQAGLTAKVSGNVLKQMRQELGYSLNSLSKKIGVTSRMIMKYENENSEVTINKAMKIYDLFGYCVFNEIDIFSSPKTAKTNLESNVSKKYVELGFFAQDTKKSPFDIIAKKGKELIFTEIGDEINPQMRSLSKLLDADNLIIFKKKKPKDIPSMTQKEFMDFQASNELVKFLKEF